MRVKICRLCKEEVHVMNGIRGKWCIDHLVQRTLEKQKKKETVSQLVKRVKEEDKNSVKYLGKKAWQSFSKYLRNKNATFQGYVQCYTCDKFKPIALIQAGHCFHRGRQNYKALDFDELHIRPQCRDCNLDKQGQVQKFQLRLTKELGIEAVEKMKWRRDNEPMLTPDELKEIRIKYK